VVRPRQPDIDTRLFAATRELLSELPYEQVTIERIAARAGVGKPAIYRRFNNKAGLVFASGITRSVPRRLPNSGNLRDDLLPAVRALRSSLLEIPRSVYADQIAAAIGDLTFAEKVQREFADPALARMLTLWNRAVDRGEIANPPDGRAALNDLAGALIFEVMVRHGTADEAYLEALVDRLLVGVQSDPARRGANPVGR
jgi:AcrR family transcriptional regulator